MPRDRLCQRVPEPLHTSLCISVDWGSRDAEAPGHDKPECSKDVLLPAAVLLSPVKAGCQAKSSCVTA
jgi:hypothetical protein